MQIFEKGTPGSMTVSFREPQETEEVQRGFLENLAWLFSEAIHCKTKLMYGIDSISRK